MHIGKLHNEPEIMFSTLNQDQVREIHSKSIKILEELGMVVHHEGALQLLKEAGAFVEADKVFIPAAMVENAIRTAPSRFTLYDRNGNAAMHVEHRNVYYGTGSDTPNRIDYESGERCKWTKKDVEDGITLCDYLENIDFVMSMGLISDVETHMNTREQYAVMLRKSKKPQIVIASGGIDLSIGSVLAYSGIMMAFAMKAGIPVPLAVTLGIFAGVIIGLCSGLLISRLRLNSLVTTLGFMSIARGLALILTKSSPIYGFPNAFKFIGSGRVGPVNVPIIIALVIVIISYILLNKTKWGYYTLALGGNEEALRRAGVATHKYRTSIYVFCAMMAAIAGMITIARLNSADPLAGWMVETDAIAAVVLGGTSLSGGRGSIVGAVLACFVLGMLDNGLILMAIPAYYQKPS
jgi:ribose transport system permease protein